jgi:hypothetical protein
LGSTVSSLGRNNSSLIGGQKYTKPDMDLNPTSKWHLSPKLWLNDTTPYYPLMRVGKTIYPDYVGGPCYVLSVNIVPRLYEASFSVPLFPFEDLYLTGLVGHQYLRLPDVLILLVQYYFWSACTTTGSTVLF